MGVVRLYLTAVAITLFVVTCAVQGCPLSDRAALLAFKSAFHESKHGIFNSWVGTDCCHNWKGIGCDQQSHHVAAINLRGESEDPIYEKSHWTGYMICTISPAICRLTRLSSVTIADWKGITDSRWIL